MKVIFVEPEDGQVLSFDIEGEGLAKEIVRLGPRKAGRLFQKRMVGVLNGMAGGDPIPDEILKGLSDEGLDRFLQDLMTEPVEIARMCFADSEGVPMPMAFSTEDNRAFGIIGVNAEGVVMAHGEGAEGQIEFVAVPYKAVTDYFRLSFLTQPSAQHRALF